MLITIALVVLSSSIIVFFAHEFASFFKKLFAIRAIKLFFPLLFVSWLVVYYGEWVTWSLLWSKVALHELIDRFARFAPTISWFIYLVQILVLFILISAPSWISSILVKSKRLYKPWPYATICGVTLWLIAAILMLVYKV